MNEPPTFEELRDALEQLDAPASRGERSTYWVLPRELGVSLTFEKTYEMLLVGARLYPRTSTVRRHLEHARWEIAGSDKQLDANWIALPAAPHFMAMAALIAVELLRAGLGTGRSLHKAFDDIEPIIDLALRRGALEEEHVVGLLGELLCLEVMLDAVAGCPERRMEVLDMWQGHQVGQRDLVIGSTAVEVKTTQQESSSHRVSGLHQVEPQGGPDSAEQGLYLLSVGLAPSEHEGQTLPDVVQRVLDRLTEPAKPEGLSVLQRSFLDDVARYGSPSSRGYNHQTMASWKVYRARFRNTFTPRLYDITDPDIRILRRRDLTGTHVSPDDIQYRMDLDPTISGANPAPDWRQAVTTLVRRAVER
jgi:hypothetical protein